MTEAEVRQFLERYFHTAFNDTEEAFAALFTPDGVLEDPVGAPPLRGREAIIGFLRAAKPKIERANVQVREIMACGDESAVRWSLDLRTRKGDHVGIEGIGNFVFNERRQLRLVREFYDVELFRKIIA
ncbi:SgcJ/EcaC family oxidoreductase [Sorangium sp. So ce296]|uniref:SgcJ/EcaC family oxidoreductase n=1 Tax=Sorangium sp. So ce296 TaxID=3133296 RepID=UPI003F6255DC